ncbi:unnamed protein product [Calypogeia fissa]
MDRFSSGKTQGAVGLVAVDLIGRIFGCGGRRRSRFKAPRNSGGLGGYSRLQDRTRSWVKLTPIRNFEGRCNNDSSSDQEDEADELFQRQRPRWSFSSDESSKRWTSSTDHYSHRRRRGYYCMRLRILSMMRIVAMMRKVRLAYRRMMNAAAASKTIVSLADLYNDIADLIPVPCTGSSSTNDGHTIVVIRPIKSAPDLSQHNVVEELPGLPYAQVFSGEKPSSLSSTRSRSTALRPNGALDSISTSVLAPKTGAGADRIHGSSSWRKFAFRRLSCVYTSNVTSCASPLSSRDPQ